MRGATSSVLISCIHHLKKNPQSYCCNVLKSYYCLNIHFYGTLNNLMCLNEQYDFFPWSFLYAIFAQTIKPSWTHNEHIIRYRKNYTWNTNKKDNNVRGSPNHWATSTKTVTSRDIYYNKSLQPAILNCHSFSILPTYSPTESTAELHIQHCIYQRH